MPLQPNEVLKSTDEETRERMIESLCTDLDVFLQRSAAELEMKGSLAYAIGSTQLTVIEQVITLYRKAGWYVGLRSKKHGQTRRHWLHIEVMRKSSKAA
jgi:hypothetical protein